RRFIGTNIAILQNKKGNFDYIMSPIDEKGNDSLELSDCIKSKITEEYNSQSTGNPVSEYSNEALNIVVISDGASDIRKTLSLVFCFQIVIILDWYHLTKRIR